MDPQGKETQVMLNTNYPAYQLQAAISAFQRASSGGDAHSTDPSEATVHPSSWAAVAALPPVIKETVALHNAADRIRKWTDVMHGMSTGAVQHGSRTPCKGFPPWVTLEVTRGGFATGRAAASGPLQPYELKLAEGAGMRTSAISTSCNPGTGFDSGDLEASCKKLQAREALSAYLLTDAGMDVLRKMLEDGAYRLKFPEQSAHLVLAWLLGRRGAMAKQAQAAALTLLDTIRPYFGHLQFAAEACEAGDEDHCSVACTSAESASVVDTLAIARFTADDAARALRAVKEPRMHAAAREAVFIWAPLEDRLVSLWLEGLPGASSAQSQPPPLSPSWIHRARLLLGQYQTLSNTHTLCRRHRRPGNTFSILLLVLGQAIAAGGHLAPGQQRRATKALHDNIRKRGAPGSPARLALRNHQAHLYRSPPAPLMAAILADRVSSLPHASSGIPAAMLPALSCPVSSTEATACVPEATPLHPSLIARLRRCLRAPLPDLIKWGTVPSAEVFASLVPPLASACAAAAYPDPHLASLVAATLTAFAARRSLLLLRLQSQVKPEELPFLSALDAFRDPLCAAPAAAATLRHVAEHFLAAFPQTMLPNVLVRELSKLARTAWPHTRVPLVEELASDIFEGAFSAHFAGATTAAAALLQGTVYERYYGLDYAAALQTLPTASSATKAPVKAMFTLCYDLASSHAPELLEAAYAPVRKGVLQPMCRGRVKANGMIIEQAQILTTHNLAVLVGVCGAKAVDEGGWGALVQRCAGKVCREVQRCHEGSLAYMCRQRSAKKVAFMWRQMVFYMAMAAAEGGGGGAVEVERTVRECGSEVARALQPHLRRLKAAELGGLEVRGLPKPLLGWAESKHPLLMCEGSASGVPA